LSTIYCSIVEVFYERKKQRPEHRFILIGFTFYFHEEAEMYFGEHTRALDFSLQQNTANFTPGFHITLISW